MSDEWITDNGHILIAGITGSKGDCGGKTGLANWWASTWGRQQRDLVIFYNAKGSTCVNGTRVHSVGEIGDAMARGQRHFNFVPRTEDWETPHQHLKEFVAALPTSMSKLVVHDETPEYAASGSLEAFLKVLGQDDGDFAGNCKSLVLAQNPVDLSKTARTQTPTNIWVGPTSKDYKPYFDSNSYTNHYEHILENHEPYQWTVMQGPRDGDRTTFAPVPEVYA
jgi:hypothetical protein